MHSFLVSVLGHEDALRSTAVVVYPAPALLIFCSYNWMVSAQAKLGDAKGVVDTIEEMGRNGLPAG